MCAAECLYKRKSSKAVPLDILARQAPGAFGYEVSQRYPELYYGLSMHAWNMPTGNVMTCVVAWFQKWNYESFVIIK